MILFRISVCKYISDLTGEGAKLFGGRWNKKGIPALYFSSSLSLAPLELMANIPDIKFIKDICSLKIEIPKSIILKKLNIKKLNQNWNKYPFDTSTVNTGTEILSKKDYCGVIVPSAILPEDLFNLEFNVLLNPLHKDFNKIKFFPPQKYFLDNRLQ